MVAVTLLFFMEPACSSNLVSCVTANSLLGCRERSPRHELVQGGRFVGSASLIPTRLHGGVCLAPGAQGGDSGPEVFFLISRVNRRNSSSSGSEAVLPGSCGPKECPVYSRGQRGITLMHTGSEMRFVVFYSVL